MRPFRILYLEDSPLDAELVRETLIEGGLPGELVRVETRDDFLAALQNDAFDLILADYSLPSFDGISALAMARECCAEVPFLFVSGAMGEERAIETLKSGATDYVLKQRLERLVPSVRRALREAEERAQRKQAEAERCQLEEALRQRADELAERDRRKDEFLAMLAHELRNPLGAVSNVVQILQLVAPDEPRLRRAIETIARQTAHQARLVDDLLDVSRITRGKISLQSEWLDLGWLLRHVVADHQNAFEAAGLALRLHLPEEPVWVAGDRTRLMQVMENLLNNALKFTPAGGEVTVQAFRRSGVQAFGADEDNPVADCADPERLNAQDHRSAAVPPERLNAVVTVRDTGIGIEPAMLPRVFDSFAQADRSLDRSKGGLGLGLTLVKGLIELHGGEVRADSLGLGHGAEFRFTLPLERTSAAEPAESDAAPSHSGGVRVLLVEDNGDAAETLRDLLELSGHQVAVAGSGPEAVLMARRTRPEVVLCDIGLPGMDGCAVARALKRDPATAAARLIALSGYGQKEDRHRSREAGFERHLTKPVDFSELQAALAVTAGERPTV